MTIPTPLTTHAKTVHRPETWNSVFDCSSQNMTVVWGTGSKRRTIVKYKFSFRSATSWRLYTFIKNIVGLPKTLDLLFTKRHLGLGHFGHNFNRIILSVYFFRHKKLFATAENYLRISGIAMYIRHNNVYAYQTYLGIIADTAQKKSCCTDVQQPK